MLLNKTESLLLMTLTTKLTHHILPSNWLYNLRSLYYFTMSFNSTVMSHSLHVDCPHPKEQIRKSHKTVDVIIPGYSIEADTIIQNIKVRKQTIYIYIYCKILKTCCTKILQKHHKHTFATDAQEKLICHVTPPQTVFIFNNYYNMNVILILQ